jgi:tetratricopeptide (TPR) repeat protein
MQTANGSNSTLPRTESNVIIVRNIKGNQVLKSRIANFRVISLTVLLFLSPFSVRQAQCQRGQIRTGGNNILYGDVKVDEGPTSNPKPLALDILLYTEAGSLVSRQTVQSNGRYRFNNLTDGRYQIVVEVENSEVARFPVDFSSPFKNEIRQDIEFEWRDTARAAGGGVVSVADKYNRPAKHVAAFDAAMQAIQRKEYDQAIITLRQIVESDPNDFPAWERLGTVYFIQKKFAEAETSYSEALKRRPNYSLVLISLGRVRIVQKNFDGAVQVLDQAVKIEPTSAQANYFLGEAYLQLKRGSKAVGYLYEALKLDPVGMADAHLRLAALYHGAGMKDKAANEYEEFLKKVPDYADRKKLEDYIAQNKKQ